MLWRGENASSEVHGLSLKFRTSLAEAVRRALGDLYEFLRRRTLLSHKKIILGPNMDHCYWWRMGGFGGIDGMGTNEAQIAIQMQRATKAGLPDIRKIPQDLLHLVYLVNFAAREIATLEQGRLAVLKHFPGGDRLELTESTEVLIEQGLAAALRTSLTPFALAFSAARPPRAVMISHAKYSFETELRGQYSKLAKFYPFEAGPMPASLSPAITRGLLRTHFGFKGMIVSDWFCMSAIERFVAGLTVRSAGNLIFDIAAKKVILASYAGINWAGGLDNVDEGTVGYVEDYYNAEPGFQRIFDANIVESLFLAVKNADPKFLGSRFKFADLGYDDLQKPSSELSEAGLKERRELEGFVLGLPMADKIAILTRHGGRNPEVTRLANYYSQNSDIWNRGGIIMLKFLKDVVAHFNGRKYPDPPRDIAREHAWVTSLMGDKDFRAALESIRFDDPDVIAVFRQELPRWAEIVRPTLQKRP